MSKDLRNKEIKVGFITILAIILLIIGISLGNNVNFGANEKIVTLEFNSASGIGLSAPVYVNGVKRGKVTAINPYYDKVRIKIKIDRVDDFKSDVIARINMAEITGGKKIDIYPGNSDVKFNETSIIKGYTSPDMGEMIAMLGDMGKEAQILLKRLDTLSATAIKLTSEKDAYDRLDKTIENTAQMVETANQFVQNNVKNLQKAVNNLTELTENFKKAYEKYEPRVDKITRNLELSLSDTKKLLNNADDAVKNANELLVEFKKIAKDIQTDSSFVHKILYDKNFASQLDSTLTDLQNLVKMIKEHGINVNVRLGTRP